MLGSWRNLRARSAVSEVVLLAFIFCTAEGVSFAGDDSSVPGSVLLLCQVGIDLLLVCDILTASMLNSSEVMMSCPRAYASANSEAIMPVCLRFSYGSDLTVVATSLPGSFTSFHSPFHGLLQLKAGDPSSPLPALILHS